MINTSFLSANIIFPEIEGWEKSQKTKVFDTESLWEYINGAADYYLNFGFEELEVCEYSVSENKYIKVEVYKHKNPVNAFGIYAYERSPETNYIDIGNEAYLEHSSLNLYTASYYVKIFSHQKDDFTIATIKRLAEEVSKRLEPNPSLPELLTLLPVENKIEKTDIYFPTNYMAYSFLNNVLEAKYKAETKKYKVFIIKNDNEQSSKETIDKYLNAVKQVSEVIPENIIGINDMFNGYIVVSYLGNTIFGISGTEDKEFARKKLTEILAKQ